MSRVICGLKISSTPIPSLPLSSTVATPGAFMPFDTKQGPEPQEERVDVQALEVARKQQACTNRAASRLLPPPLDGGRLWEIPPALRASWNE
jgi:hypothetical protein